MTQNINELPALPDGWEWTTLGKVTKAIDKVMPQNEPDKEFFYLDQYLRQNIL